MMDDHCHQPEEVCGGAVVRNNREGEGHRGWQGRQQRWGAGAIHKNLGLGVPWLFHNCFGDSWPVLQFQRRPCLLVQFRAVLTRFMSKEMILIDIHHQEFIKLHMLVPLQGCAVAGPTEPLEVDAQALRELP